MLLHDRKERKLTKQLSQPGEKKGSCGEGVRGVLYTEEEGFVREYDGEEGVVGGYKGEGVVGGTREKELWGTREKRELWGTR